MKELKLGKYTIDVSHVVHGRIEKAKMMWDEYFIKDTESIKTAGYYNEKANEIGSYLVRQSWRNLRLKYSFLRSLKEWFIRTLILTPRYINNCNEDQYEDFHNFVSVTITGKTLEQLKKKEQMELDAIEYYHKMKEKGHTFGNLMELLETLLTKQDGQKSI